MSSAGGVSLDALLGEEVCVRLLLADGGLRSWHGHVTAALYLGTDGGLAGYRLVVEPWLAFLGQRRNCQVFQDKAVPAILEARCLPTILKRTGGSRAISPSRPARCVFSIVKRICTSSGA